MRKIIALLMTALILTAVSGCGETPETADSYADKLASGELKPDADIAEGGSTKKSTKKKKAKKADKVDVVEETKQPETENKPVENVEQPVSKPQTAPVKLSLSEAEMGAMIDKFDDEYKSFEVTAISSPEFFMGKNLRLGAVIANHQLSQVYAQQIRAAFSPQKMTVSSSDASGQTNSMDYYIYSVAANVAKTPSGRDFSYVSYGSEDPSGGEINGVIGVMARVICSKPEAMGEAKADEYILLIESGQPEVYQLFLAE